VCYIHDQVRNVMKTGRKLLQSFYWTVIIGAITVVHLLGLGAWAVAAPPMIAAASSLRFGLTEVAQIYYRDTGAKVRLSFGSSGNFARQIRQGAPFKVFMSADESYVLNLAQDKFTIGKGVLYAIGRVAIFSPVGSPLKVDAAMQGLRLLVKNRKLKYFAIANPEHAPYGRAAREVLIHAGLWAKIRPHLVLGENISQAAQFALSKSTQGGLLAYSLVLSPPFTGQGESVLIPASWHKPLRQRMALVKGAGQTAQRFYQYIQQKPARTILRLYGFFHSMGVE